LFTSTLCSRHRELVFVSVVMLTQTVLDSSNRSPLIDNRPWKENQQIKNCINISMFRKFIKYKGPNTSGSYAAFRMFQRKNLPVSSVVKRQENNYSRTARCRTFKVSYEFRIVEGSDLRPNWMFVFWRDSPQWARVSFARFVDHTQRGSTIGRTPLDEWSARRRELYMTEHNTHNRQTPMSPMGFETTTPAGKRPQIRFLNLCGGSGKMQEKTQNNRPQLNFEQATCRI
jgi:hypothetical protein